MKTTVYFDNHVLRDRPEINPQWCKRVITNPIATEVQADGRVRFWGIIPEMGDRVLRVITLEDGETIHNAFFDRNFGKRLQKESNYP